MRVKYILLVIHKNTVNISSFSPHQDSSLNKTSREINSTQISISSDTDEDEDQLQNSTRVCDCNTDHRISSQDIFPNRTRYRCPRLINFKNIHLSFQVIGRKGCKVFKIISRGQLSLRNI